MMPLGATETFVDGQSYGEGNLVIYSVSHDRGVVLTEGWHGVDVWTMMRWAQDAARNNSVFQKYRDPTMFLQRTSTLRRE